MVQSGRRIWEQTLFNASMRRLHWQKKQHTVTPTWSDAVIKVFFHVTDRRPEFQVNGAGRSMIEDLALQNHIQAQSSILLVFTAK